MTRFAIAFAFLYLLELAVIVLWPSVPRALASGMANLVGGILSFAGISHSVSGWTIALQSPSLSFNIGWGCLGGELFWSYIALVFAETAATRKQRLRGILVGLAILMAFNFFRITLSIYVEGLTGFQCPLSFLLRQYILCPAGLAGMAADDKTQASEICRGDAIRGLCTSWKDSRLPCLLKAPEALKASVPHLLHSSAG